MTAEFALVLPAVVLMLVLGLGVAQLGAIQVRLADAAADAARMVGREQQIDRVTPASETDGTYIPRATPKPTKSAKPSAAP